MTQQSSRASFSSLWAQIKSSPAPLLPPAKASKPSLTSEIASLQLHPTLEALLHIYNQDLPSAHFLVRHMQGAPAFEGMYIHGLLHRIEGDYANCLAWYADVSESAVFESFYGSADGSKQGPVAELLEFLSPEERQRCSPKDENEKQPAQECARIFIRSIDRLQQASKMGSDFDRRKANLQKVSAAELEALVDWCISKFGTEKLEDASAAWSQPSQETKEIGERMVSGGEGYRKF